MPPEGYVPLEQRLNLWDAGIDPDDPNPIYDQVCIDLTIESMIRSDEAALVEEIAMYLELVGGWDLL